MFKYLQLLIWDFIIQNKIFDAGIVRSRGKRYMERGRITSIEKHSDEYIVLNISEWIECNTTSSLATWGLPNGSQGSTVQSKRLFVTPNTLSLSFRLIGIGAMIVITFKVPAIGDCELYTAKALIDPRLGSCDFVKK